MVMTIALWADGRRGVGAGHLVRSRVLGEALAQRGHVLQYYSNDRDGAAQWAWRGIPWQLSEASELMAADLRIIDGYAAQVDPGAVPLLRIHDAAQPPLPEANLVLDPGPDADPQRAPYATAIMGLGYNLQRREFAEQIWQNNAGLGTAPIVVIPGGGDAAGILPKVLPLLAQENFTQYGILVAGIRDEQLAAYPQCRGLGWLDASALAHILSTCALAITTASTSALEALAVGCPLLAIDAIANQRGIAQALREQGITVAELAQVSREHIQQALTKGPQREPLLDGQGAQRAARRIEQWWWCHKRAHYLRPVCWSDAPTLFHWQQDPGIRAASLAGGTITWEGHQSWLRQRLLDPQSHLLMAQEDQVTVGTLRLHCDAQAGEALVSIAVAPQARGQGWGPRLLAELFTYAKVHQIAGRLRALVRLDNPASLRCFGKAGYQRMADTVINGHGSAVFLQELSHEFL